LRPAVIAVLDKAMSHRPESRYPSAAAFVGELFNSLDHRAAAVRFRRFAAAGFCFLLVAVIAVHLWINREKENTMLRQEAQITASQVGIVRSLLEAGYLDQRLLAETVRGAVDRLKALVNGGQRHPDVLRTLFMAQMQYGLMHGHPGTLHLGSVEIGIRSIEDAIRTLRLMSRAMGEDEQYANFSLWSRDTLASLLIEAGQYERSAAIANEGLRLIETWESARTFRRDFTHNRGSLLMTLSRVAFHRNNWEECLQLRSEGVRLHRLVAQRNKNPGLLYDVAGVLAARGYLYREMGRFDEAAADYAESDAILARMHSSGVRSLSNDWMVARNGLEKARTLLLMNRRAEAESLLIDTVSRHRLLIEENPHAIPIRRTLALSLSWLATTQHALGRPPDGWHPLFLEAYEIASNALVRDPQNMKAREEVALIQGQARAAGVDLPASPLTVQAIP
jgi:tetratricopeptide (TPR) repeat protein